MNLSRTSPRTALILGGGGSTGNAWLIGVVAGFFESGLDIARADLVVGTSAGATAAAQLTDANATDLFADTLAAVPVPVPGPAPGVPASAAPPARPLADHLARMRAIIDSSEDAADYRRRMGRAALEKDAASDGSWTSRWRTIVASRLASEVWPASRMLLTAVDAETGDRVAFDRDSGVDLVDAVAASTAGGGSAYRIGARRYIDGGYRTNADNADLAAGYDRVLILSPLSGRALTPAAWGTHLETQIDALRAAGSRVESIFPDDADLFGANAMNPSLRPTAARAGYAQGSALSTRIADLWG